MTYNIPIGLKGKKASKLILTGVKSFQISVSGEKSETLGPGLGRKELANASSRTWKKTNKNNKRKENAYTSPEGHPYMGTLPENLK